MPTKGPQRKQSPWLESTGRQRNLFKRIGRRAWKVFLKLLGKPEGMNDPLRKPMEQTGVSFAASVRKAELTTDDIIVLIMGPTGAGKSTFIQRATGQDGVVGYSLAPDTIKISATRIEFPDGTNVVLVDTPGFGAGTSNWSVFGTIERWVRDIRDRGLKLSGILYLHRISDNRIEDAVLKNFAKAINPVCGEEILRKVILTTTMWSEVADDDKQEVLKREADLKEYWAQAINGGPTALRFENTEASAWSILSYVIRAAAV